MFWLKNPCSIFESTASVWIRNQISIQYLELHLWWIWKVMFKSVSVGPKKHVWQGKPFIILEITWVSYGILTLTCGIEIMEFCEIILEKSSSVYPIGCRMCSKGKTIQLFLELTWFVKSRYNCTKGYEISNIWILQILYAVMPLFKSPYNHHSDQEYILALTKYSVYSLLN